VQKQSVVCFCGETSVARYNACKQMGLATKVSHHNAKEEDPVT